MSTTLAQLFAKELEQDLDWRLSELAVLKIQAAQAAARTTLHGGLLRALVALLYAHYEGFCKQALRGYMELLVRHAVQRQALADNIKLLSLSHIFRKFHSDLSAPSCWKFFQNTLPTELVSPVSFALDKNGEFLLEGDSNMYPALLSSNLDNLNVPKSFVDNNAIRLKTLVDQRNGIAHGRKLTVSSLADYEAFEKVVSDVMYELAYCLVDAAEKKTYLLSPPTSTGSSPNPGPPLPPTSS